MPLQNRVLPSGEIVAIAARGTMMGNRGGAFHDAGRRLGTRRWLSRQWICCVLDFKQRHRAVMSPGRYTELFFLDEATALSAGHRPCFECRRQAANEFAACWKRASGATALPRAADMDRVLHQERVARDGTKRTHQMDLATLPTGTIIRDEAPDGFLLVQDDGLRPWSAAGYGSPVTRAREGLVTVMTPPSIIAAMKCGYRPIVHETARDPL